MKPKGKKPRGAAGSLTLDLPRAAHFEPLHLPDTKAAIEEVVLRAALSSSDGLLSRLYGLRGCPIRNPEDHFDFTLPVQPSGEHFLDLSEFVYPTRVGDPCSRADGWYVV